MYVGTYLNTKTSKVVKKFDLFLLGTLSQRKIGTFKFDSSSSLLNRFTFTNKIKFFSYFLGIGTIFF